MTTTLYILFGIIILGLGAIIFLLYRKLESKGSDSGSMSQLNQNIQGLETRVSRSMSEISNSFNSRLENTSKTIAQFNRELGVVQEMNQQMKDLQSMIKSPKLRGNIGERIMENLLKDILPKESYATQYQFAKGQLVDAVIKVQDELIPIDSKFPIENFEKILKTNKKQEQVIYKKRFINDVRKHIRDIADKYIKPDEKTVNFAVMYIPSETIFYYIIKSRELHDYANERRIYITSPNIFHYFLQTIMIGIERNKVSQASKTILANLKGIQQDAKEFNQRIAVLDKHITNAKTQMSSTKDSFAGIKNKIDNTADIGQVHSDHAIETKEKEINTDIEVKNEVEEREKDRVYLNRL